MAEIDVELVHYAYGLMYESAVKVYEILELSKISTKNLGSAAHSDKDFQKLFFCGLKFLLATPARYGTCCRYGF